jgi:hypothetical protein
MLYRYFPGGTEERRKILSQDCGCPVRDLNWAPPEYITEALPFKSAFSAPPAEVMNTNIRVKRRVSYWMKTEG